MSTASAGLAKKLGYTNIRVYLDGEPAWSKANLPTYSTTEFIKNGNVVLRGSKPKPAEVVQHAYLGGYLKSISAKIASKSIG